MTEDLTIHVKSIDDKLGILIDLMLTEGELSLQAKIALLDRHGLKPAAIATVLGKTPSHIRKELTLLRRK